MAIAYAEKPATQERPQPEQPPTIDTAVADGFYVVYEGAPGAGKIGGKAGLRNMNYYLDRADYEADRSEDWIPIGEFTDHAEADKLCRQMPPGVVLRACIDEAYCPSTGQVSGSTLMMRLINMRLCMPELPIDMEEVLKAMDSLGLGLDNLGQ